MGTAALAAGAPRLRALTWIAPGHEAAALTSQPAMCPKAGSTLPQAVAGRALFNAPMLLGYDDGVAEYEISLGPGAARAGSARFPRLQRTGCSCA